MKITIDGRDDILSTDDGYAVGDILKQIEAYLIKQGLRSGSRKLDGTEIDRRDALLLKKPVEDFALLEIETIEVRKKALRALGEVRSHLPGIIQKIKGVSEEIQSGNLVGGYKMLGSCAEMMNLIVRVVEEVRALMGIEMSALETTDTSATKLLEDVRDVLKETKQALDSRDTVTVADLMEYELAPKINGWDKVLERLIEKVSG